MAVQSIKQLENGVVEYDLGYAIVRLPLEGPTEKELKVIENAAKDFYKAVQRQAAQSKTQGGVSSGNGNGCACVC